MTHRKFERKTPDCNNFANFSPRDALIMRIGLIHDLYPRDEIEEWKTLPLNPDYAISTWGRCLHLFSYGRKPRLLFPTIKNNRYPFLTITLNGKRKGLSLNKIVDEIFQD